MNVSKDWNGNVTRYTYDVFGRLDKVFEPGDALDKPSKEYRYHLQLPVSRIVGRFRVEQNGSEQIKRIQCYDGMGRVFPGTFYESSRILFCDPSQIN